MLPQRMLRMFAILLLCLMFTLNGVRGQASLRSRGTRRRAVTTTSCSAGLPWNTITDTLVPSLANPLAFEGVEDQLARFGLSNLPVASVISPSCSGCTCVYTFSSEAPSFALSASEQLISTSGVAMGGISSVSATGTHTTTHSFSVEIEKFVDADILCPGLPSTQHTLYRINSLSYEARHASLLMYSRSGAVHSGSGDVTFRYALDTVSGIPSQFCANLDNNRDALRSFARYLSIVPEVGVEYVLPGSGVVDVVPRQFVPVMTVVPIHHESVTVTERLAFQTTVKNHLLRISEELASLTSAATRFTEMALKMNGDLAMDQVFNEIAALANAAVGSMNLQSLVDAWILKCRPDFASLSTSEKRVASRLAFGLAPSSTVDFDLSELDRVFRTEGLEWYDVFRLIQGRFSAFTQQWDAVYIAGENRMCTRHWDLTTSESVPNSVTTSAWNALFSVVGTPDAGQLSVQKQSVKAIVTNVCTTGSTSTAPLPPLVMYSARATNGTGSVSMEYDHLVSDISSKPLSVGEWDDGVVVKFGSSFTQVFVQAPGQTCPQIGNVSYAIPVMSAGAAKAASIPGIEDTVGILLENRFDRALECLPSRFYSGCSDLAAEQAAASEFFAQPGSIVNTPYRVVCDDVSGVCASILNVYHEFLAPSRLDDLLRTNHPLYWQTKYVPATVHTHFQSVALSSDTNVQPVTWTTKTTELLETSLVVTTKPVTALKFGLMHGSTAYDSRSSLRARYNSNLNRFTGQLDVHVPVELELLVNEPTKQCPGASWDTVGNSDFFASPAKAQSSNFGKCAAFGGLTDEVLQYAIPELLDSYVAFANDNSTYLTMSFSENVSPGLFAASDPLSALLKPESRAGPRELRGARELSVTAPSSLQTIACIEVKNSFAQYKCPPGCQLHNPYLDVGSLNTQNGCEWVSVETDANSGLHKFTSAAALNADEMTVYLQNGTSLASSVTTAALLPPLASMADFSNFASSIGADFSATVEGMEPNLELVISLAELEVDISTNAPPFVGKTEIFQKGFFDPEDATYNPLNTETTSVTMNYINPQVERFLTVSVAEWRAPEVVARPEVFSQLIIPSATTDAQKAQSCPLFVSVDGSYPKLIDLTYSALTGSGVTRTIGGKSVKFNTQPLVFPGTGVDGGPDFVAEVLKTTVTNALNLAIDVTEQCAWFPQPVSRFEFSEPVQMTLQTASVSAVYQVSSEVSVDATFGFFLDSLLSAGGSDFSLTAQFTFDLINVQTIVNEYTVKAVCNVMWFPPASSEFVDWTLDYVATPGDTAIADDLAVLAGGGEVPTPLSQGWWRVMFTDADPNSFVLSSPVSLLVTQLAQSLAALDPYATGDNDASVFAGDDMQEGIPVLPAGDSLLGMLNEYGIVDKIKSFLTSILPFDADELSTLTAKKIVFRLLTSVRDLTDGPQPSSNTTTGARKKRRASCKGANSAILEEREVCGGLIYLAFRTIRLIMVEAVRATGACTPPNSDNLKSASNGLPIEMTMQPTVTPGEPTKTPTPYPTQSPTQAPTQAPTMAPTQAPTIGVNSTSKAPTTASPTAPPPCPYLDVIDSVNNALTAICPILKKNNPQFDCDSIFDLVDVCLVRKPKIDLDELVHPGSTAKALDGITDDTYVFRIKVTPTWCWKAEGPPFANFPALIFTGKFCAGVSIVIELGGTSGFKISPVKLGPGTGFVAKIVAGAALSQTEGGVQMGDTPSFQIDRLGVILGPPIPNPQNGPAMTELILKMIKDALPPEDTGDNRGNGTMSLGAGTPSGPVDIGEAVITFGTERAMDIGDIVNALKIGAFAIFDFDASFWVWLKFAITNTIRPTITIPIPFLFEKLKDLAGQLADGAVKKANTLAKVKTSRSNHAGQCFGTPKKEFFCTKPPCAISKTAKCKMYFNATETVIPPENQPGCRVPVCDICCEMPFPVCSTTTETSEFGQLCLRHCGMKGKCNPHLAFAPSREDIGVNHPALTKLLLAPATLTGATTCTTAFPPGYDADMGKEPYFNCPIAAVNKANRCLNQAPDVVRFPTASNTHIYGAARDYCANTVHGLARNKSAVGRDCAACGMIYPCFSGVCTGFATKKPK